MSIHLIPPADFRAEMECAGCFIVVEDLILYLKRHISRPYGETWGIPAGKKEGDETPLQTMRREVQEELGLDIVSSRFLGTLYCRMPDLDYILHLFVATFPVPPPFYLNTEEHTEARWLKPDQIEQLPLIVNGKKVLHFFRDHGAEQQN